MAHNINTATSEIQRAIMRAKMESDIKHLSCTFDRDADICNVLLNAYRDNTDPLFFNMTVFQPRNAIQFLAMHSDHIRVFTNPMVATNSSGETIYLASMGDELGTTSPVSIPAYEFHGTITVLMPKTDAEALGLLQMAKPPDTIPGVGDDPDDPDVTEAPSMARLNFGPDAVQQNPVIVEIPKFLAVPRGLHIPTGPWSIYDTAVNDDIKGTFRIIEDWRMAIVHAVINNGGKSVTAENSTLFVHDELGDDVPEGVNDNIEADFTMLNCYSEHYILCKGAVDTIHDAAYTRLAERLPPQATAGPPAPLATAPPTQAGLGADQVKALVEGIFTGTTATRTAPQSLQDVEQLASAEDIGRRLALVFAELVPDPNGGNPTVRPARINEAFMDILKLSKSSASIAVTRFQELMRAQELDAAREDNRLDWGNSFTPEMVDGVLLGTIKNYNIVLDGTNVYPDNLKTKLSLVVFAAPKIESVDFRERMQHGQLVASQATAGEHSSKSARKATELYIGGKISTAADIAALLRNCRQFFHCISEDFSRSEWWKSLALYEKSLTGTNGRIWTERFAVHPQGGLNMLIEVQDYSTNYWEIGTKTELRRALADGNEIDPAIYLTANTKANNTISGLDTALQSLKFGEAYKGIPLAARLFPSLLLARDEAPPARPTPAPAPAPDTRGGATSRTPGNGRGRDTRAHGAKGGDRGGADNDLAKSKGFLIWSGDGKAPFINVFAKLSGMPNEERICNQFVMQGRFCPYGKSCRAAHPGTFAALPGQAKTDLISMVHKTKGLDFAPGAGPPGTK